MWGQLTRGSSIHGRIRFMSPPKRKRSRFWLLIALATTLMVASEGAQELYNTWLDNRARTQLRLDARVLKPAREIYRRCDNQLSNHERNDMPDLDETIGLLARVGTVSASKVMDPPVFDLQVPDEQVEWRCLSGFGGASGNGRA